MPHHGDDDLGEKTQQRVPFTLFSDHTRIGPRSIWFFSESMNFSTVSRLR